MNCFWSRGFEILNVSLTKKVILTKSEAKNADKYIVIFPSLTRNFNGNALIKTKLKNHKNYTHVASFFYFVWTYFATKSKKKILLLLFMSTSSKRNVSKHSDKILNRGHVSCVYLENFIKFIVATIRNTALFFQTLDSLFLEHQ